MVNYIEYVAGSNKGDMKQGEMLNSPFGLGKVDANYTSDRVVETLGADKKLMWAPVAKIVRATTATGEDVDVSDWTVAADGTVAGTGAEAGVKVAYIYDNVVIPQNDLPVISAEMKSIPLIAKARRIAIYYSQMAAFQAKNDYGFDLGDQLAEKAVGQLSYEIDTEVTQMLIDNAPNDSDLVWSKTLPVGVSKQEHYKLYVA